MPCTRWMKLGAAICLAVATAWGAADLRLNYAVQRRDTKAFENLLAQGVDIDAAAPDGATALWQSITSVGEAAGANA